MMLYLTMLGELLNENEVLAGMIIDLGLIPVDLCTPTLMSKINEEIYAKSQFQQWTQQRCDDVREFCQYFAHRCHSDKFYREQSELFAPRYVDLFDS